MKIVDMINWENDKIVKWYYKLRVQSKFID